MYSLRLFGVRAELAIEIPKIGPFGQSLSSLTLDVLTNLVFDGIQHAVWMLAGKTELKGFFHGVLQGFDAGQARCSTGSRYIGDYQA